MGAGASQYLVKEEDNVTMLDPGTMCRRLMGLHDPTIHEDFLTASPGMVYAFDSHTHELVEHTCSAVPCISGGAGKS